jgi:hypothetical protein
MILVSKLSITLQIIDHGTAVTCFQISTQTANYLSC